MDHEPGKIPVAEYAQLAKQFNPVKFDADQWVRIAQDAGMKYMAITSKHHDGFAMFGSKVSPYNVVNATPFHRDVVGELRGGLPQARHAARVLLLAVAGLASARRPESRGSWDPAQDGDFDVYLAASPSRRCGKSSATTVPYR